MTEEALQEQLEHRWQTLPIPATDGRVATVDLPSPTGHGPLLLARSTAGRSLLVPFATNQHRTYRVDQRSAAVQLLRRPLRIDGADRWFAELTCLRSELDSIFSAFCADVIIRIAKEPAKEPTEIAARALQRWRSFFSGGGRRLGPQQLRGLFAELVVLERLVSEPGGEVATWTGPLRRPHDFRAGSRAAEIKATGIGETIVRIHGVDQLLAPNDGILMLAHFQVAENDSGRSVPDLVAAIRKRTGPSPLMARLELAGYQTADQKHYENLLLRAEQETWYAVDESFPKIVPASFTKCQVPPGVGDIHYDIDLAASSPTVLDAPDIAEHMEGLRRTP